MELNRFDTGGVKKTKPREAQWSRKTERVSG
jgi:hypothetical protein